MFDPLENGLFDIPDYDKIEDEAFPPLPPPMSPGQDDNEGDPFANGDGDGEEEGDVSKLPEVPKRRGVKRPQPKLDSQRLTSERGLPALRSLFDNVRFKGKGHEAEDLRVLVQRMENWAHRLYPKLQFEDFIDKLESLGAKKEVQTCLKRIRLDMPLTHEDFISKEDEPQDRVPDDSFGEVAFPEEPLIHSTPAPAPGQVSLSDEQRRRIELNKQLALERRLARMQQNQGVSQSDVCGDGGEASRSSTRDQDQETTSSQHTDLVTPEDQAPPPDSPSSDEGETPVPQLTNGIEDSSD